MKYIVRLRKKGCVDMYIAPHNCTTYDHHHAKVFETMAGVMGNNTMDPLNRLDLNYYDIVTKVLVEEHHTMYAILEELSTL